MNANRTLILLIMAAILVGCITGQAATPEELSPATSPTSLPPAVSTQTSPAPDATIEAAPATEMPQAAEPEATPEIFPATAITPPEPTPTLAPDAWMSLPVIPEISETTRQIYLHGVELGNNPRAFSKVGDCGSTPAWFLGDFDRGPKYYRLGEYQHLEAVIQEFNGSYGRTSLAAKSGFNASSVFVTLWANSSQCGSNETPLACEYRVHKPVIAFIMLGTNDVWRQEEFEGQMRQIIEFSIVNGVVPVLSTKADNLEGDFSINATIARLAMEYDIPLINYWAALQDLPDLGLQPDGSHITWGGNRFDDPEAMKKGWPVRNLTSLQALDAIWRSVTAGNLSP